MPLKFKQTGVFLHRSSIARPDHNFLSISAHFCWGTQSPELMEISAFYHVRHIRKRGRGIERERMARNLILAAILLSAAVLPSRTRTAAASEDEEEGERERETAERGGESLNGRKQQSAAAAAASTAAPYEYSPADNDWPHILKTGCVRPMVRSPLEAKHAKVS